MGHRFSQLAGIFVGLMIVFVRTTCKLMPDPLQVQLLLTAGHQCFSGSWKTKVHIPFQARPLTLPLGHLGQVRRRAPPPVPQDAEARVLACATSLCNRDDQTKVDSWHVLALNSTLFAATAERYGAQNQMVWGSLKFGIWRVPEGSRYHLLIQPGKCTSLSKEHAGLPKSMPEDFEAAIFCGTFWELMGIPTREVYFSPYVCWALALLGGGGGQIPNTTFFGPRNSSGPLWAQSRDLLLPF